jgi:arginine kinase
MSHGKKTSLTQKYFPANTWDLLTKRTSFGTTIYDCAKSALENPNSNVGLYAPDPEVYDVFAELFHPVISEYHKVDIATLTSVHDLGDAKNLRDLPQNYQDAIVSTRVRVGRTVKGYPMAGKLTKEVNFIIILFLKNLSFCIALCIYRNVLN